MDELEAIKVPPIQSSPFDELATKPEHYKYFRCKHGDWNIVKTEDILPLKHLAKESKRKITIHSEVNYDVGIAFKKFSKNFGNYNAAIAVLIDNWNKHNS